MGPEPGRSRKQPGGAAWQSLIPPGGTGWQGPGPAREAVRWDPVPARGPSRQLLTGVTTGETPAVCAASKVRA
jgi:hypothetical protein